MNKTVEKLKEEFLALLPPTIFFFVALHIIGLVRLLTTKGTGLPVTSSAQIALAALIIGKGVLLADLWPAINRFPQKPLIYNIAWKTVIYFTVAEMERVLEAGAAHDLPGKVHVNQFTSIGGIQAAVKHGALSVDHLEVMEEADLDALTGSRTIPTLLPSCSFFLRIPYGPARQIMDRDLPLALATDHNPGSTPSGNMNLVLSLACIQLRMLPEEAINAMTMNSAAAMGLSEELGSITIGKRASLIITKPVPSLAYLPYAFGNDHIDTVVIDGTPVRAGAVC